MNTMVKLPEGGLRNNTTVQGLLDAAQSRHLTVQEQQQYISALPEEGARMKAVAEVAAVEKSVVAKTVAEILSIYPFKHFHDYGPEKCSRDVTFVSIYATHAMLCNDMEWFKDKFLFWMRTMIMSFGFPAQAVDATDMELGNTPNPFPDITQRASGYASDVGAIYDTYTRLARHFEKELSPESWALMEQPLRTVVEVLAPESE